MAEPAERRADPIGPVVFMVFSVLGVGYIIVAKLLQFDPVVVTLVPVLLMVGYACLIWAFRALRLRSDQSGDNFYYMGFIFTLTSLALTLIQFSDGANAAQIVRNFGVAVASTIAGIVLRIVFNLFRRDPLEVEHEARIELAEAARKVRQELNGVLLELSHFSRTHQQMIIESFEETRAQVERSAEASEAFLQSTAKRLEENLGGEANTEAIMRVRSELAQTAEIIRSINEKLLVTPWGITPRSNWWSRMFSRRRMPSAGLRERES